MQAQALDLNDELDSLTADLEELTDEIAGYDVGSKAYQQLGFQAGRVDDYRNGIAWYINEYDSDEITLRPLTDGRRRAVRDVTEKHPYDRDQCLVAVGSVDAPYVAHDPDALTPSNDDLKQTLANIADLHPDFVDWVAGKVDDLGSMEDELGNSYETMLIQKLTQAQTGQTGSDTHE